MAGLRCVRGGPGLATPAERSVRRPRALRRPRRRAAPGSAQRLHQVTDIAPAPAPKVTEVVAQSKACPCCGEVTEGEPPAHVRARASFGPEAHAQAVSLVIGHHVRVYRSTLLLCE